MPLKSCTSEGISASRRSDIRYNRVHCLPLPKSILYIPRPHQRPQTLKNAFQSQFQFQHAICSLKTPSHKLLSHHWSRLHRWSIIPRHTLRALIPLQRHILAVWRRIGAALIRLPVGWRRPTPELRVLVSFWSLFRGFSPAAPEPGQAPNAEVDAGDEEDDDYVGDC